MAGVIIENPALDKARAVVHSDALHDWVLRGWEPQGPAAEGADGLLTEQEWAAELVRRESQIQAVMAASTTPSTRSTTAKKG